MQSFGWRFGWAAPCHELLSLKAASGFPFFDGLAHHALPGMFSYHIIDAARPDNRATQTVMLFMTYCQSHAKSAQRGGSSNNQPVNLNYY